MRPRGREGMRVPRGVTRPGARLSWSSTASSRWGPGGGCFVRVLVFGGLVFLFLFFFFWFLDAGSPEADSSRDAGAWALRVRPDAAAPALTPSSRPWPCCRRDPSAAGGRRGGRTPASLLCPGRSPCEGRGCRRERQGRGWHPAPPRAQLGKSRLRGGPLRPSSRTYGAAGRLSHCASVLGPYF